MRGKIFIAGLVLIALLAGAGYYYYTSSMSPAIGTLDTGNQNQSPAKTYESSEYGIRFQYPASYRLVEQNASKAGQERYALVIADAEALDNAPQNGEGPTAITFEIYSFAAEGQTLEQWVRNTNESNFRLSADGALAARAVGNTDVQGFAYTWDGLYRGESIAFEHRGRAIVASVTTITSNDEIRTDFNRILSTLELF